MPRSVQKAAIDCDRSRALREKLPFVVQLEYLRRVADIFGFDGPGFERIRASHLDPQEADPYEVLGVARDATDAEVKKTYRQLIRENHPDKLMAQGLPQEFIDLANEKMAHINAAYDRIEKERKLR